jgi:hypothetical protein
VSRHRPRRWAAAFFGCHTARTSRDPRRLEPASPRTDRFRPYPRELAADPCVTFCHPGISPRRSGRSPATLFPGARTCVPHALPGRSAFRRGAP